MHGGCRDIDMEIRDYLMVSKAEMARRFYHVMEDVKTFGEIGLLDEALDTISEVVLFIDTLRILPTLLLQR